MQKTKSQQCQQGVTPGSPMSAKALSGVASLVILAAGCTGCGGGSSKASGPGPSPIVAPPADVNYYNVPSNPLGAVVTGANVTFSYWNPAASSVSVSLYANWNDPLSSPAASIPMTKDATTGIWSSAATPLPSQNFYVYDVAGTSVLDPYARSMAEWVHQGTTVIAGDSVGKGAILDTAPIVPDNGWATTVGTYFDGSAMTPAYSYHSNRDAIIYEAGVRDLTVDPNLTGFAAGHTWGTYKGMVDILPHIQKLGVTHIQLLCPLENYNYDQTKIGTREMSAAITSGANYNWGYDPQNYFTPTGMYSASPTNPAARIQEMKTLINEIHKAGMGVIIDVVFNHTANNAVLCDSGLLGEYYRTTTDNGAGSNDVRSDYIMTRKLIVDSIQQWVSAYHADGFRFDLMGVIDYQTLNAAYSAAQALNPKVIFLGEGWEGFYSGASTDYNGNATGSSDQANSTQFLGKNIGMFSDSYRQIFKNGYPSDGAPAFLTTAGQSAAALLSNVQGLPTNTNTVFAPGSTDNVVNYLTCHDNLCLYDTLAMATNASKSADGVVLQRAKIGYAILLTSQGTAFIHAGDEMFRTKETTVAGAPNSLGSLNGRSFVDNSYNASDAINMVNWSTVYTGSPISNGFTNYATTSNGYQLYAYTQGLIAIRKASNAFRLPDASIAANVTLIPATAAPASTLAFGYKAISTDNTGTYYVLHNASLTPQTFSVPSLTAARLLADGNSAGLATIASSTTATLSNGGTLVTLAPLSSAIFKN